MGIFDKIKHAIFGGEAQAAQPASPAAPAGTPTPATPMGSPAAAPAAPAPATPAPAPTPAAAAPSPASSPSSSAPVDIVPILDAAVKKSGQKLEWRKSIVDLMKALDLDSSLTARKELAQELHYTGDTDDSATMNVWLHKALMKKLAENGGKVPADLAD
jgi:3-oxoacyl-ACP reductase-like protein